MESGPEPGMSVRLIAAKMGRSPFTAVARACWVRTLAQILALPTREPLDDDLE